MSQHDEMKWWNGFDWQDDQPTGPRVDEEEVLRSSVRMLLKRYGVVFVFGSNEGGVHGAGAALEAKTHFGAEYRVGVGRAGQSYAIPSKDKNFHVLPLSTIQTHVSDFLSYAEKHPNRDFFVTRIGCGLAGFMDKEIAPLFAGAPKNCILPFLWTKGT